MVGRVCSVPDPARYPEPFTPQASPAALADLRTRLRATRWPDSPEDAGWSLGTDVSYLRELVAYWADGFDWPAQEAALARLPRFRVPLGDAAIHFVHGRAAGPAGATARAWTKWIPRPPSDTRNRGSALSAASCAGQSNSSAQ